MSRKIADYLVCASWELAVMQSQVNEWLSRGWRLYGGPFANEGCFCQAMVKEANEEET